MRPAMATLPKTLKALPALEHGHYVVLVPHYWGRGATLAEAVRACRGTGARSLARVVVAWKSDEEAMLEAPAGAKLEQRLPYVDDMGRLMSYGGPCKVLLDA